MKALITAWICILYCSMSLAAPFKPAVIYDTAGKFDKSFNEAVYKGGVRPLMEKHSIKVREVSPKSETQIESGLVKLAKRGYQPIVAVGFSMKPHVEKVAKDFPDIQFTIIDAKIDLPNVQSILFKEQEGSFLVGALAALTTKTNKIGFVGGMDIPMIHKFACGYQQGGQTDQA
ncbi:BMP family ABC transporter substrate-binding protein [Zooshikella harenae]|uniref:BMP family ABC transporter substrate-binding protein n=1 Tax=Zooshikella harenae TaxID=2827238 RepID=UPI002815D4AE|nr:BMP family ABC transporter substrate-binding protein [Zooshikella harenae]